MSGYQQRIQGMDRLLRIRRMRRALYLALLGVTTFLMYARAQSEGASIKPFFFPLDGLIELGLIMGLVGTFLSLYLKNLELKGCQTDSQRYLLTKFSMSRALSTAVIACVLAVILVIPMTSSGLGSALTQPGQPITIGPRSSETLIFSSPDAFGVTYSRYIHVQANSGTTSITVVRDGRAFPSETVSGSQFKDLDIEPTGWTTNSNWSVIFRNSATNSSSSVTYSMPLGVMPSLFSIVPFFLFLYVAANVGWWFGLRPIRDRTKTEATYAGTESVVQLDQGERAYVEYAMAAQSPGAPAATGFADPPPPPPAAPPPPPLPASIVTPTVPAPAPQPAPRAAPVPETAESLAAKGDTLMTILQYPSAIAAYEESLRFGPKNLRVLLAKASAHQALQEFPPALDAYKRALAVDPTNEAALRGSAKVLARLSRWRECLESVDAILRRKPTDMEALELKGDALTNLGRRPEALSAYEGAQALNPQDANLRQKIEEVRVDVPGLLSRALIASASGNYGQALVLFDEILEVEPGNVNALIGKAVAYRRYGKPNEALNCLDMVLDYQPNNASALLNRGNLQVETGDLDGALETYEKLVAVSPHDEDAWSAEADVYLRMGRDDDALRAFAEALKLNPGDETIRDRIHELEGSRATKADVLQDLYQIKGVGPARAKALVDAGFRTAEDFQKASVDQLLAVKGITRRIAEDLVKRFRAPVVVTAR